MNSEIKDLIMAEVKRQTEPLYKQMDEVKAQNGAQFNLLHDLRDKVGDFDHWRKALWGNGSGNPGFLDRARQEDKLVLNDLRARLDVIAAKEQQELGIENYQKTESEKRHIRYARTMDALKIIVGSGFGAWLLEHFLHLYK